MTAAPSIDSLSTDQRIALDAALREGLKPFNVPSPQNLEEWARDHFYLSETTQVEQHWTPWPFQRAIMACISHDDIREVTLKKSARIGFTRLLLAAVGYFAHHHRRNQIIWQPTDEDRDEFVKADLDLMLRDVACMVDVMPSNVSRHKHNTLHMKKFLGSVLYTKGGKAAKNYRRIAAAVAYFDELSAFDRDVEKEGSPFALGAKRLEGATFPKMVAGSTPKTRGFCLIDDRFIAADHRFTYHIPCPHCGHMHPLTWGGKDHPHGMKWINREAGTVAQLCPGCGALYTQAEFLRVHELGKYISEDQTIHLHADGRFTDPVGKPSAPPPHIAFHVWTAYNPTVSWASLLAEYLAAYEKYQGGDSATLKTFTNVTLGECWEDQVERTEAAELQLRAEPFQPKQMPRDCLLLLCGADTQDNRVELGVWGYGRDGEMWSIDHKVIFGNPALPQLWAEVEAFLREQQYTHASGVPQHIYATAIDSGGHHANAVYAFAHRLKHLRVHAIKGVAMRERSIENGNTRVSFNWQGRVEKNGPVLWHVGTNLAKDRFHSRLEVRVPGPGYVHLCKHMSDEWFKQLAGEQRALRRTHVGSETRWSATRARIEVKDCLTYAIWLEERLDLWAPRRAAFWTALERVVNPPPDLFNQRPQQYEQDQAEEPPRARIPLPIAPLPKPPRRQVSAGI